MFFNQNGILNIDEAIMNKESFKKIMAANWQSIPGATPQKKPAGTF